MSKDVSLCGQLSTVSKNMRGLGKLVDVSIVRSWNLPGLLGC